MPLITITTMKTPSATNPSSTMTAAAARGMCVESFATSGIATVATIAAATSGPTIVEVVASSQITPARRRENPDEQPGSPTEVTEPARRGEDRRQSLQLDDAYFGPVGADRRDAAVLVSAVLREAHSHGFLLRTTTAFSFDLHTRVEPDALRGRPETAAELAATNATAMSPLRHAAVAHAVVDGMSVLVRLAITIRALQTARRREPA